ncbi:Wzz/FepE/Etk N-terminal domain-containing protein [Escherichia coli]
MRSCAGLLISFILPQKWTSAAVVTPPEPVQWQELEKHSLSFECWIWISKLIVQKHLTCLSRSFQSVSLLEEYLRSSPYVIDQIKRGENR